MARLGQAYEWQRALLLLVLLWCFSTGVRADDDDDDDGGVDNDNLLQNYDFMDVDGVVPEDWTLTGSGGVVANLVNNIANTQGMGLASHDPNNPTTFLQHVSTTANTEYSITFWAYRNTTTATSTNVNHNLSISFGSQTWAVDPPTHWSNYSFSSRVTDTGVNVQWSSYDISGGYFVLGDPCFFLTDGDDDDDNPSGTHTVSGTSPTPLPTSGKSTTKSTAVVGGAIGASLGGLLVLAIAGFLLWRRKQNQQNTGAAMKMNDISPTETEEGKAPQFTNTPWVIPSLRDQSPPTAPVMTNMAIPANTSSNFDRSISTNMNDRSSSRNDAVMPSLTYASSVATPSPTFISSPPEYGQSSPRSIASGSHSISQALQLGLNGAPFHDDEVGRWAAGNRDNISPDLEQKLRDAHYRPSDDPKEISDNIWNDRYGVGHFELKRIQELYERNSFTSDVKLKDTHGSGQGGATWRASEISS